MGWLAPIGIWQLCNQFHASMGWLQAPRFCVWSRTPLAAPSRGLLGVALQRRSWAPTFVWQVELMTQEDCPWSRAIGFRGKAGGAAGRKRSRSGPTSFARLLASCFLRSNLTLVDQVALARSIPSAWSSPFLVSLPPSRRRVRCDTSLLGFESSWVRGDSKHLRAGRTSQWALGEVRLLLRPRGFA